MKVMKKLMRVQIKKLNKNAKLPVYSSEGAAGADLYALLENDFVIKPQETVLIPTGISMAIPSGYVGIIYARSGLATKLGLVLANQAGIIDSDYRGEIMVAIYNRSNVEQIITNHQRIAQMVITSYIEANFEEIDELVSTSRGEGGFGSTGI